MTIDTKLILVILSIFVYSNVFCGRLTGQKHSNKPESVIYLALFS